MTIIAVMEEQEPAKCDAIFLLRQVREKELVKFRLLLIADQGIVVLNKGSGPKLRAT